MIRIVRFSVERWQFTVLATALVICLGLAAFLSIPRTEDPQIDAPIFFVSAVLPGTSPEDMELEVTKPIEEALGTLDKVSELRSSSRDDIATVRVEFMWGADPDRSYDKVVRELDALRAKLPANISRLTIDRGRATAVPFVQVALTSGILPSDRLEKLALRLKDRISRISGVRKAEVSGVDAGEMRVEIDLQRLAAEKISASAVIEALRAGGTETPIGAIHVGERRFIVRFGGAYSDVSAIRAIPVERRNGSLTRVGDLAKVNWATPEAEHILRFNGKPAALVVAEQLDGQDVVRLTKAVEQELSGFERELPGSVRLEPGFRQAGNLEYRLRRLTRDFVLALFIVSLALLPLGWRAAGIVIVAIPLSLLIGVAVLENTGFSLNQLSIAGFVLSLGLLVDDAIVVVENIARWLREGVSRKEAAIGATRQIGLAVLGCTACLAFAFLPLLMLPEASGEFIRSLPVAVLGTITGSLVVSLLLVPFIASRALSPEADTHGNWFLRILSTGTQQLYSPSLRWALNRPWLSLGLLALLSLLSLPLLGVIGTSLFPEADLPQFVVEVSLPQGSSLAHTDRIVQHVAHRIAAEPSIRWTIANTGRANPVLYYNTFPRELGTAGGEVAAAFDHWDPDSSPEIINRLRHDFLYIPGAKVTVHTFTQGPPVEAPVALRISGPDMTVLTRLAREGEAVLRSMPALRDIGNPLRVDSTELDLGIDAVKATAMGVRAGDVQKVTQLALSGVPVARFRDSDGDFYPVTVRLPTKGRNDISVLALVEVPTQGGGTVPLTVLGSPTLRTGPAEINHTNRERTVTLTANVREGALTSRATGQAFEAVRRALRLPPGYNLTLAGEAETQSRSFAGLGPAIATALLGIMAVLVLEFGHFRTAAVVASVVPLGMIGAMTALLLTGNSLSFTASIGLIALVGIEIKNSILLVDFTEQLRRTGMPMRAALEQAGELRFLPVLLTSVTAIGGLMPLAIERNGLYSPMAIGMIGGLVSSTVLTRIATPVLYLLLAPKDVTQAPA